MRMIAHKTVSPNTYKSIATRHRENISVGKMLNATAVNCLATISEIEQFRKSIKIGLVFKHGTFINSASKAVIPLVRSKRCSPISHPVSIS